MNFTVWNKKNCIIHTIVPGNCFLRMETGIFYELEFYLRCFIGSFLRFKIWAFVKSEHASKQVTGESTDGCVICPCCVIESFAFYTDPVFCTFQLCLQLFEVLIGFQVGISFGDSEQAAQCTTYFRLVPFDRPAFFRESGHRR